MGVMNPRYTIFRKPKESMRDIYIYTYIYIYTNKKYSILNLQNWSKCKIHLLPL